MTRQLVTCPVCKTDQYTYGKRICNHSFDNTFCPGSRVMVIASMKTALKAVDYQIGATQSLAHSNDTNIGMARFTCHEWEHHVHKPSKVTASYSVEVQLSFNPETKRWEMKELRQWEGKF
jgi:hypothetical protein